MLLASHKFCEFPESWWRCTEMSVACRLGGNLYLGPTESVFGEFGRFEV